ncbi:hypothetical protein ABZ027_21555 [Streptomyces sp. NPDC006332]|uniref:hypothetical protein n=1 Tax=Streptomyces sp. NPDC006332 TaxID=3155456 RepID=UPI0033B0F334
MKGFSRRPLLAVDAQGYGRSSPRRQHWIQQSIPHVLDEAAEEVGFVRGAWQTQVAGDSALSVLPVEESEPLLVDDFMRHLDNALRAVNDGREPDAWLTLRAAVHHGPAVPAAGGFSDSGPVEVSRILNCKQLKEALRLSAGARLAVAVSREVFNTVVVREYTTLRTSEFREIRVREKEFDDAVWIRVLGGDIHALGDLEGDTPPPEDPPAPPSGPAPSNPTPAGPTGQHSVQVFEAPVHGSVIGIVNNNRL